MTAGGEAGGGGGAGQQTAWQALVYDLPVFKGVCVLAVIATHTSASIWRPFAWPIVPEVLLNTLARFAVPLFVVLSGFYLSLSPRNEKPALYRRALPGLLWPYVVYTVVYAGVRAGSVAGFAAQLPEYLRHGSASPHLWFIPVIVELYLLHPWLRRLWRRAGRPVAVTMAAVLLQAGYVVFYEYVLRPAGPFTGWADLAVSATSCFKFIGFFVAGYALRDFAPAVAAASGRPRVCAAAAAVWLAVGAVLPLLWVWQGVPVPAVSPTWLTASRIALEWLAVPLAAAALCVLVARPRGLALPRGVRWAVRTCGLYAYGVYYLHPLVLSGVAYVYWTFARPLMRPGPLRALLLFTTVTLASIAVVKLLTRLPLTRRLA